MVQSSDKTPPNLEKTDKVLKELRQKAEKTQEIYIKFLSELQKLQAEHIELISKEHLKYLSDIRVSSGIENITLYSKIANKINKASSILFPWIRKNRKRKYTTYKYLESVTDSLTKYNQHENNFKMILLNYAQQIAPLINDRASEVSRQVTVLPVERMDILFIELMKEIDQIKTEVDRLNKIIDKKTDK